MNTELVEFIQGKKIEILEMILTSKDHQLQLLWKGNLNNSIVTIVFDNVSRFTMENVSAPLEVHGFEIIDNRQNGWEEDSRYEIRDFEEHSIHFFCGHFRVKVVAQD